MARVPKARYTRELMSRKGDCYGNAAMESFHGLLKTELVRSLEQINFEKVYLLCKDLPANPCHEMLVGELGSPLRKHFKVKML